MSFSSSQWSAKVGRLNNQRTFPIAPSNDSFISCKVVSIQTLKLSNTPHSLLLLMYATPARTVFDRLLSADDEQLKEFQEKRPEIFFSAKGMSPHPESTSFAWLCGVG